MAHLERALGWILAIALTASMTVVVIDVVGRYLFLSPLKGADDLNSILIGIMVFAGLPLVTAREDHIRVDLLTALMPPPLRRGLHRIFALVGAGVLAVMAVKLWTTGAIFAGFNDRTPMLRLPIAPFAYAMAVLAAISAALQLALALRPSSLAPGRR